MVRTSQPGGISDEFITVYRFSYFPTISFPTCFCLTWNADIRRQVSNLGFPLMEIYIRPTCLMCNFDVSLTAINKQIPTCLFVFKLFRFNFNDEPKPNSNFDSFPTAILTVFQVSLL